MEAVLITALAYVTAALLRRLTPEREEWPWLEP
jgi:hypothetical protein